MENANVGQLATVELPQMHTDHEPHRLAKLAVISLVCQHFSSAWGERSYEFASYLYLIVLFPTTLLPASVFGLLVTITGISFSGWIGSLVDKYRRLPFIRCAITAQKLLQAASYAFFLLFFRVSGNGDISNKLAYPLLALIIVSGSLLGLATTGINVAIQRDWAVTISQGSSSSLTQLNTYLRRADLLCKLLAPLFVSLLTTTTSYSISIMILLAIAVITLVTEQLWIGVVWNRFTILCTEEISRRENTSTQTRSTVQRESRLVRTAAAFRRHLQDVKEFYRLPIFLSSVAISLVYLTTLSFDGIMLSYLKAERSFSDAFIAGMRGICVVTGLAGTVIMPGLEKRFGLVRAGAWSIWSQILCLVPVAVSLYLSTVPQSPGPAWNVVLLFAFLALSRIGLWSFDLIQLQLLQEALATHPRRNALTAIQISLQNVFDLIKYIMVIGLSKPDQFKWTALVSCVAVFLGGIIYSTYVYRVRGHLAHWHWIRLGSVGDHARDMPTGNGNAQYRRPLFGLRIRRLVAS